MAKLLHEDEYNALIADRERLEWMLKHRGHWDWINDQFGLLEWDDENCLDAETPRYAIDRARGVA